MAKLTKRISGNELTFPAGESRENPGTGAPAADEFVCEE